MILLTFIVRDRGMVFRNERREGTHPYCYEGDGVVKT